MTPTPLSPQVQEWRDKLHAAIVNLPCDPSYMKEQYRSAYDYGFRDARHAAAELALSAVPFNQVPPEQTSDDDWFAKFALRELLRRGASPEAMSLAVQLFGVGPCETCGYRKLHCRCAGQPGEALPAEQPKSEIAYPTSASGGDDLQTALAGRKP